MLAELPATGAARRRWLEGMARFARWARGDRRAALSLGFLLAVLVVAAVPSWLAPHDPIAQDLDVVLDGPSSAHWLGTDDLGRDVLSRLVYGTRASATASLLAVAIGLTIGVPLGLLSGLIGGWVDDVVMRVVDAVLSFPGLVLAVALTGALGPDLTNAMIAVGIVFSPALARLVRSQVLSTKERGYVDAARTFGSGHWWIILRHLLPNAVQPLIVQAALFLGAALLAEASLSFLGLGVQPPDPSWGSMLQRASLYLERAPVPVVSSGLVITLTVLAVNTLGDALRDALDPRAPKRSMRAVAGSGPAQPADPRQAGLP